MGIPFHLIDEMEISEFFDFLDVYEIHEIDEKFKLIEAGLIPKVQNTARVNQLSFRRDLLFGDNPFEVDKAKREKQRNQFEREEKARIKQASKYGRLNSGNSS